VADRRPAVPRCSPVDRPERRRGAPIVEPRPAATVVLLRPGATGLEVLLTRRASGLRFAGDMWVFPGGRLDPDDAGHAEAAARETLEETGIAIHPRTLVPMTRWVTPPGLPSRYDARFFAAFVPPETAVVAASDEVGEWRWTTASAALANHGTGALPMWQPTVVTLQQLLTIRDEADLRAAFEPGAAMPQPPVIREVADGLRELDQPWAGGIEGRRRRGWLVGRTSWVVVDPADPTGESADVALAAAAAAGASIVGVALT